MSYPRAAWAAGVRRAQVDVEFEILPEGAIENPRVVGAKPHPAIQAEALAAIRRFRCIGVGRTVTVKVPFSFRFE